MQKSQERPKKTSPTPPQHQDRQPGLESAMHPSPESIRTDYSASGKLKGKVAVITGGDSGIGRAVSLTYAAEGADIILAYLDEHADAADTANSIEEFGRTCILMPGDIGRPEFCEELIQNAMASFGRIDILVNNAGEQHVKKSIEEIDEEQLERTFRTNIFSMFYLVKAALPHLQAGARIINTASVTAYRGSQHLLDYSATKGAIVAFTRSLSQQLIKRAILVNAVAPGPVWTPLIPASFDAQEVSEFGASTPMGRPGQPSEIAPSYVFLASDDSSFMSGQVLHPNGGEIING
jgi:NAD(P)-dependent dehydrogenase (short-subunit alcohol dehydrogenase family)